MIMENDYNYKDEVFTEPMTTDGLFRRICRILEERGEMPDILEYASETSKSIPIADYSFCQTNCLDFGGSEGIYVDEGIRFRENGTFKELSLGIFKTCDESQKAMEIMGKLNADFVYECTRYVNANLDNFTWTGYDIDFYRDGMQTGGCSGFESFDKAKARAKEFAEKHDGESFGIVIRENATRKEWKYEVKN